MQEQVDLERAAELRREMRAQHLVGVVDPSGRVREVICKPDKGGADSLRRGNVPVEFIQGEVRVTVYGKEKGWKLLQDLCERDGVPELYGRWRETIAARDSGVPVFLDPKDLSSIYPPSVLAMREGASKAKATSQMFVPGKGLVDVAGLSEEQRKERVRRLSGEIDALPASKKKGAA